MVVQKIHERDHGQRRLCSERMLDVLATDILLMVRSRSLNHLDTLEMRYGVQCASDTTLKDSRSEPDCTRPLLAPPAPNIEPPSPTSDAPISRRHVLSRSQ
ncbi:hypothetical protein Trydic_g549, partial [Trypoxylus dichotomus]